MFSGLARSSCLFSTALLLSVNESFHVFATAVAYATLCLLKSLESLLLGGKCLLMSCRKSRAMFVLTFYNIRRIWRETLSSDICNFKIY